ncbi:MAG: RnfABCDGE type electron transport complex subunit D [Microcoleaceae cyanobacterium]
MFKDARHAQILFLASFLILGISTRDWTVHPQQIIVVIVSCLLTQAIATVAITWNLQPTSATRQPFYSSWKSALITALGLCLLLRTNHPMTMALAGSLAIASKFLFRYQGKHFFNPANFGIIATLLLTQDAWVSPGQWGTDWWYFLLFAATGGMILKQVGRWETSAVFLGVYASLEALRNLWLGWSWDVYTHHLTSGSLLLFALFMLTDPRSIPNARWSRIIWATAIAWVTFILQHQFFVTTAIFWALFFLSPLTLILDSIWSESRFNWGASRIVANSDRL